MTREEILDKVRFVGELRGLAATTLNNYYLYIRQYQNYYGKPADELTVSDVQRYLHYLLTERRLKKGSVDLANGALRFLYRRVLEAPLDGEKIPRHGKSRQLPNILSREKTLDLFEAAGSLRNRCILMTAYGAGLRVSEVAKLRVSDIDSGKMQIFICGGKGDKDRFAILSQVNLELLREYWKAYRPKDWMFYPRGHKEKHLGTRAIQKMLDKTLTKAGIPGNVTMHTLRHSFATHLLEDGADLFCIKQLLGHSRIASTCKYLHMLSAAQMGVVSPLDKLSRDV